MAEEKKTYVHYFQVSPVIEGLDADEKKHFYKEIDALILKDINGCVPIDHSDGNVNLYDLSERHDRYIFGTFVYNQTSNIPPSYNELENKPTALKIGDFDGLGFDSSFIYDKKTRVFGIESKKPGASPKAIYNFLMKSYGLPNFSMKILVLPDEYKKFLNSSQYTRLEINLAIPNNDMGILKENQKIPNEILDLMQELKGSKAKIIVSNGRSRKKTLSSEIVRQLAQWAKLSNTGEDVVKDLKITGMDYETEKNHIYDIITNRLVTNISVPKFRTIGNFQIKSKYDQLEGSFLKYREQIELLQI